MFTVRVTSATGGKRAKLTLQEIELVPDDPIQGGPLPVGEIGSGQVNGTVLLYTEPLAIRLPP